MPVVDYDFHPDEPTVRVFRVEDRGVLHLDHDIAVYEVLVDDVVLRHYAFGSRWYKINVTTDLGGNPTEHNMIIRGGSNIYPTEVENLLGRHPAVKDVAVIGVPDDQSGEAVHAVVVRHPGTDATEAEILAWCDGRTASYKQPTSIAFIADADMPRTATGKILHRTLRDRWSTTGT